MMAAYDKLVEAAGKAIKTAKFEILNDIEKLAKDLTASSKLDIKNIIEYLRKDLNTRRPSGKAKRKMTGYNLYVREKMGDADFVNGMKCDKGEKPLKFVSEAWKALPSSERKAYNKRAAEMSNVDHGSSSETTLTNKTSSREEDDEDDDDEDDENDDEIAPTQPMEPVIPPKAASTRGKAKRSANAVENVGENVAPTRRSTRQKAA